MSMSVDEIRNVVLLFSNPSWTGVGTVSSTVIRNITALSSDMAYSARFTGNTTVLSTRFAETPNGVIQGLLYVPDLQYGDACAEETAPHIPRAAVRPCDLPPMNYHLVALAPWVSQRCSCAFMASVKMDPVRAFIFYLPGNASDPPPPADSPDWHIQNDTDWRTKTAYPVYAVSGMVGEAMMQHLSLYSGNMSEVPFGNNITDRFETDPQDYLRIWTELAISTPPVLLGTWVYLLIVVGVLVTVVSSTSFLMHFAQARRRAGLRRRVRAGQVNLEAMGIKHLTVPTEHIQKFPLFTYHYEPGPGTPPLSPRSVKTNRSLPGTRSLDQAEIAAGSRLSPPATVVEQAVGDPSASSAVPATDYQPTCEICLEPYENRTTVIRELSCGHIFHPECIDEFLHEVSSLCPICKASMLPKGYCPKVTNAMVRRERAIRRLRGRIQVQDEAPARGFQGWRSAIRSRIFGPGSGPAQSNSTELQAISEKSPARPAELRLEPHHEDGDGHSRGVPAALARERMRELAGFEPDYGEGGLARWQRVRNRVFPGFQ